MSDRVLEGACGQVSCSPDRSFEPLNVGELQGRQRQPYSYHYGEIKARGPTQDASLAAALAIGDKAGFWGVLSAGVWGLLSAYVSESGQPAQ